LHDESLAKFNRWAQVLTVNLILIPETDLYSSLRRLNWRGCVVRPYVKGQDGACPSINELHMFDHVVAKLRASAFANQPSWKATASQEATA
jgi:hypothetical protein